MTPRPVARAARSAAPLAAALLALGVLAGCTAAPEPKPTATETPDAAQSDPGVVQITDAPGSGTDYAGALADNSDLVCEQDGDTWTVSGVLTNSTDAAANYRVYVSLLDADNDTRALQQVNVDGVEPATPTDWTMSIATPDDDLSCVPRIERYVAG